IHAVAILFRDGSPVAAVPAQFADKAVIEANPCVARAGKDLETDPRLELVAVGIVGDGEWRALADGEILGLEPDGRGGARSFAFLFVDGENRPRSQTIEAAASSFAVIFQETLAEDEDGHAIAPIEGEREIER